MTLNTGPPWSDLALSDLRASLEQGDTVEQAATFLCRDVDEVRAKAEELGTQYSLSRTQVAGGVI